MISTFLSLNSPLPPLSPRDRGGAGGAPRRHTGTMTDTVEGKWDASYTTIYIFAFYSGEEGSLFHEHTRS